MFFGKKQDDAQDNPRRPSSPSGENRSRHTDDSLVQTVMQEGLPGGLPLPPAPAAPPQSPKEPQVQQAAPEPSPEKGDKPGQVGKLIRLCTYLGLKLLRRAKQAQRRARRYTVRLGDSLTREKDVLRDNLAETGKSSPARWKAWNPPRARGISGGCPPPWRPSSGSSPSWGGSCAGPSTMSAPWRHCCCSSPLSAITTGLHTA